MKFIKFLILTLIFFGGVYVGYKYLPKPDASLRAVVALPALNINEAELNNENLLKILKESGASEAALLRAEDTLLLKDYAVKKAVYEAELAKSNPGASPSGALLSASAAYNSAAVNLEKRFAARAAQAESLAQSSPQEQLK